MNDLVIPAHMILGLIFGLLFMLIGVILLMAGHR